MSVVKEKLRLGVKGDASVLVLSLSADMMITSEEADVFALALDARRSPREFSARCGPECIRHGACRA